MKTTCQRRAQEKAKEQKEINKKSITKIVTSKKKAYENFNFDIIKIRKYNFINLKN